ncbi:5-oxoprolinase subunit PxpB [Bacillus infantis]|uniref:5-oxoprolinase subunit PxpB n=1 Tax=Bacillus infantis TaxID=324767 RepID=A0A5D4SQF9_9BACI|nr:5-oxoprolinase subunit PxpB [Bacillus infantis]TYS65209.1 5-oxoprolinase subunit PxpB [Bacillus infantis]
MHYHTYAAGDSCIILEFGSSIGPGSNQKVRKAASLLSKKPFRGMIECVPAFHTLAVHYDPYAVGTLSPFESASSLIAEMLAEKIQLNVQSPRLLDIPVCYEGAHAPDLAFVARSNGLSEKEVIEIHSKRDYEIYFLGFSPGFPFLGGMDPRIAAPRKTSPRLKIPSGSVGIAGGQTGIYPSETPGGWQIIGRTPIALFDPNREEPSYLKPGDRLRFIPIKEAEFQSGGGSLWE